jgi:hypothetical protein
MNQRQINCRAYVMAQELLDLCQNLLDPENRQSAFEAFYELSKRHLEAFRLEQERMMMRLRPMQN